MIANPSDPTGIPLFSRFARNDAMKHKTRESASSVTPSRIVKSIEYARRKAVEYAGFDKRESREQRERRFARSYVPPVGQYNPTRKERPKLVWDVLKAYQHELTKQRERQSRVTQSKHLATQSLQEVASEAEVEGSQPNMSSLLGQSSLMSSLSSQCMVDMSRTTGRKEEKLEESVDWGDTDIMRPLACIRERITKKIDFSKQVQPIKERRRGSNWEYNYDYRLVKPRSGWIDFGSVRGREEKARADHNYSYQHYEYDAYVRQGNSRVFPNTKKQLISFRKQMHRYKEAAPQLPQI